MRNPLFTPEYALEAAVEESSLQKLELADDCATVAAKLEDKVCGTDEANHNEFPSTSADPDEELDFQVSVY